MHFFCRDLIDDRELRDWIAKRRRVRPEQVLIGVSDALRSDPKYAVYCEREVLPRGDFRLFVALLEPESSLGEELEEAQQFVAEFDTENLWDHHEDNPYEFVHVRQDSPLVAVYLQADLFDDHGCCAISSVVSEEFLGTLYFPSPVSERSVRKLLGSWYGVCPEAIGSRAFARPVGPVASYSHEVSPRVNGVLFNHGLDIFLYGTRDWNLPSVRAQEWVAAASSLAAELASEVCAYHPSFRTTRNIPGGSDSETHCMHIGREGSRRIPLKSCRASW